MGEAGRPDNLFYKLSFKTEIVGPRRRVIWSFHTDRTNTPKVCTSLRNELAVEEMR